MLKPLVKLKPSDVYKALFFLSLGVMIAVNVMYSKLPILESHGWRQTQTAITSYYFQKDGFKLNYETPVRGEPWSIPLEFPIYQYLTALIPKYVGIELAQAGRLVNLIFTFLTCIPLYFTLKKLNISETARYITLILYLSSPVYFFWAGTFMIEGAALFFSISFLYYVVVCSSPSGNNFKNLSGAFFFLSMALLQKITTPLCILITWSGIYCWINKKDIFKFCWDKIKILTAVLTACIVGYAWIKYADFLKIDHPAASGLISSNMTEWNFGTWAQRLSKTLWLDVIYYRNIRVIGLNWLGLVVICIALFAGRSRERLVIIGALILFLFPFLVFTNLHLVHNYYQLSNDIFFIVALGISIASLIDIYKSTFREYIGVFIVIIFAGFNYYYFFTEYYLIKSQISPESNRTLAVSRYVREFSNPNRPIIVYGYSWSSEIPFYSERRANAPWNDGYEGNLKAITEWERNFSVKPGAVVLCPISNMELERKAVDDKFGKIQPQLVKDCEIYLIP